MSGTEVTTEVQVDNNDDLDAFTSEFFGRNTDEPADGSVTAARTKAEVGQDSEVDEAEVADQTDQTTDNDDVEELKKEFIEPPAKKKTVQDRIDELVKQREDVKRDFEAQLAQQRREFESKLAELKPAEPIKAVSGEPTPLDKAQDGTEKYPLGEFDPAYIRDLTRYTLEAERNQANQKAQAEQQQRQQQEQRVQLQTSWNSKLETATTDYPDLLEKGQVLVNRLGTTLEPSYAQFLTDTLMEMDHGPQVLYYLSSNLDEAMKIVNSGARKATLALGRIEARFSEAAAEKLAAKPKVSKAPVPPIARARGTNGAFISVAPDTDDLDAFTREFFQ